MFALIREAHLTQRRQMVRVAGSLWLTKGPSSHTGSPQAAHHQLHCFFPCQEEDPPHVVHKREAKTMKTNVRQSDSSHSINRRNTVFFLRSHFAPRMFCTDAFPWLARSYDRCWRMFSSCPDGYSLVCGLRGHSLRGRSAVSTQLIYQQSDCEKTPRAGRRFQRPSARELGKGRTSPR